MSRGTESEESLEKRTKNAVAEVEYGLENGNFDAIIVNDDLNDACVQFQHVIEKMYGNELLL
jgi:guanylate kinase